MIKELIERWKAKMPVFWEKIYKVALTLSGLQVIILPFLENATIKNHIPSYLIEILEVTLTASITATLLAKLTRQEPK